MILDNRKLTTLEEMRCKREWHAPEGGREGGGRLVKCVRSGSKCGGESADTTLKVSWFRVDPEIVPEFGGTGSVDLQVNR